MATRATKVEISPNLSLVLLVVIVAVPMLAQSSLNGRETLETVVARMTTAQQANHERTRAYTVIRQYTLTSEKSSEADSVTAEIHFVPPGTKEYSIREDSAGGQSEKVVRRILDHEAEIANQWDRSALSEANYKFSFVGREVIDGRDCIALSIVPRRESKELIRGKAFVDASTYQVRRIVGEPAKNPSWWVKHVTITLDFQNVRGMWLQTSTHADAEVRFFGRHALDSRDVDYRISETLAEKLSARNPAMPVPAQPAVRGAVRPGHHSSPVPVLGTGVVHGPH